MHPQSDHSQETVQAAGTPWNTDWSPLREFLETGRRFLLTTHVNADGDGLGSEAALARVLRAWGKEVWILNPSRIPSVFRFLFEGLDCPVLDDPSAAAGELPESFDRGVILDVSSIHRVGEVAAVLRSSACPLLVVDHHLSNEMEADLCYAYPQISSTGEVLYNFFTRSEIAIDPAAALALYTSIFTDSGGFVYASTTDRTLEAAAELVRRGADPCRVNELVNQQYPRARYELMARFLSSMRSHREGRLLSFRLTREMYHETGTAQEHSEGFPNLGLNIAGCRMTIILTDLEDSRTKINFRCKEPFNVCELAAGFGGGGHRFAAGATVERALEELEPQVLAAAKRQIRDLGRSEAGSPGA